EITGPTAVIGGGMALHGVEVMTNGAKNLASQNGRVEVTGNSNSSGGGNKKNKSNNTSSNSSNKQKKEYGQSGGSEHKKNARPSSQGKHEKGQARKNQDRQGYKGMQLPPRKRPDGWKGPWPPKS